MSNLGDKIWYYIKNCAVTSDTNPGIVLVAYEGCYASEIQGKVTNSIRYNSPYSLRVSVGELYKLDNRIVEIHTVWQKTFLVFSVNHFMTSLIEVNFIERI